MKAFFLALLTACSMGSTNAPSMDVHTLQAAMESNPALVVVDVRTSVEFAAGHVPNAINVPLDRIHDAPELEVYRDQEVYLICQSGARSGRAQGILNDSQFSTTNITGGTSAWQRAGYPIE
jgi:rhodanese-related sulfurtransferase